MSMMAAINVAVSLQLARDKPDVAADFRRIMGGDAANGYQYTETTIDAFLQSVSNRLKIYSPSLAYDWTRSDTVKCLLADREVLIGLIASNVAIVSEAS